MTQTVSSLGEHSLISRITARLAMPPWVIVGPGDDAAVIEPERGALEVLTTDALVEGVHFDQRFVPPHAIGYRSLAANLSDLAAMGARPRAALLSLILPPMLEVGVVDGIVDGLLDLAAVHRVPLIGGNITSSPGPLVVDVTVTGSVGRRRVLRRGGARPGDEVYVTGSLGDAATGLQALRTASADGLTGPLATDRYAACEDRYLHPAPRVRAGLLLGRSRAATSCIDLSDGLGDGVRQLCSASSVGMRIDASALPISDQARRWHERLGLDVVETALKGGDDYELLFTVKGTQRGRLRTVRQQAGDLPITRIGVVTRDRQLIVADPKIERALPAGFEHFRT